jgi:hypothetical protein
LASEPRAALQAIHAWLDLPFEEQQLDLGGRDRHNLNGNRFRFDPGGPIRVDLEWSSALDAAQQSAILELTREAWDPKLEVLGLHHHARHDRGFALAAGGRPR